MKFHWFVIAASLAFGACRPGPVVAPDMTPLPSAETVLKELQAKAGTRNSLRTMGRVTYFGDKGRVRLKAVLLARRPGAFRVETLSPFEEPVDVMACDGQRLWLLSQNRLHVGAATPANISRLLPLAMGPGAVVDTLLGGIPAEGVAAHSLERAEDGLWKLSLTMAGGEPALLWIDPVKHRVQQMQLLGPNAVVKLTVKFSKFAPVASGGELPEKIEIHLADEDAEVTIRLKSPEVNVDVADSLFSIATPPGMVSIPLGG